MRLGRPQRSTLLLLCFLIPLMLYLNLIEDKVFKESHRGLSAEVHSAASLISEGAENIVTFYNVFISPDPEKTKVDLSIVEEQLQTRRTSIFPNSPLYYVTSGKNLTLPNCNNCKQMDHMENGTEVDTLSKVYEYCKDNDNTEKEVIYMHNNMGSIHPSENNINLQRRMHTKSIYSKECLNDRLLLSSAHECNVCSSRFSPFPHFHASGNMWVASCSYVAKLLPPDTFKESMDNVFESIHDNRKDILNIEDIDSLIGRGNFSAKHWIHSHPDVSPCDVYPGTYTMGDHIPAANDNWEPILVHGPRYDMTDYMKYDFMSKFKQGPKKWFNMLYGRVYEWKILYDGKMPPKDSWVWKFYEDAGDVFPLPNNVQIEDAMLFV